MYPLAELVGIWMALYDVYTLATDIPFVTESAGEALSLAARKYRGLVDEVIKGGCDDYAILSRSSCGKALKALDAAWSQRGFTSTANLHALSLFDFYKFAGAIWEHHDVALYCPEERRIMILRMNEQDFKAVQRSLVMKTGRLPFLATFMMIRRCELYPAFGRIKRLHSTQIDPNSLKPCQSHAELVSWCAEAFSLGATDFQDRLRGRAHADLTRYIVARFGGGYAFYEPIISSGFVRKAERDRVAPEAYRFILDVEDLTFHAQLPGELLFDPKFFPQHFVGKRAIFFVLLPVGLEVNELLRMPAQLLAVSEMMAPFDTTLAESKGTPASCNLPLISEVRAELEPPRFSFDEFGGFLKAIKPAVSMTYHEGDMVIGDRLEMIRIGGNGEILGWTSPRIKVEYDSILRTFLRRKRMPPNKLMHRT